MSFDCKVSRDRIKLSGELTIYFAAQAKERVIKALKRQRKLTLDLSGVEEIDTAGVQVLLLARRLCESAGGRFAVIEPSAAARETLGLCGLDKWIAEPSATES